MKQSNDKFRESFEKSPIGIIFFDKEGNLTDANQSALEIGEIPSIDDVIGLNIFNEVDMGSKEDELLEKGLINIQVPVNFDDNKKLGIYNTTLSGIAFIDLTIFVIDSGFLVQIQDITERKKGEESEEKYRSFFEDDLTGDFIATHEGRVIDCNSSFVGIYGFDNREQALNSDISKFNKSSWINLIARLKNERKIRDYQSWHKRQDGEKIYIIANVVGTFNDSDELIQVKGYIFDETERKKAEEELKESRDHLEEKVEERAAEIAEANQQLKENEQLLKEAITNLERSNEELQSFAYITSHDLQEPLRTIASFSQLIERRYKGQLDPDADEFLEFISSAAKRMKDMIQGLLEYSRIGRVEKGFVETDMNLKVEKAVSNLHTSIDESNAEIFHDPLPEVIADPDQMVRVFQNFIGNGIKFKKPQFNPRIHISAKPDNKGKEWIFSVEDNGIGMEKQYTDKIFEVFKRLHTMDKYEGTGIGLAIIKRIIERHGGRIWVESSFDVGSTFYFTIPIKNK
jgi:PAS domain S-box-containing protein